MVLLETLNLYLCIFIYLYSFGKKKQENKKWIKSRFLEYFIKYSKKRDFIQSLFSGFLPKENRSIWASVSGVFFETKVFLS